MTAAALSKATSLARQRRFEALALKIATAPEVVAARAEALKCFKDDAYARTPDGQASLQDAADQHFFGALQLATNLDPHHPEIQMMFFYAHELDGQRFPSSLHGGLENPDNIYRLIAISPDSRYVLKGVRHNPAPAQVTYELMDSVPGTEGGIGEQLGLLMDRDMVIAPDGSFTITIDADPAAGRANHIQCPPNGRCLFIRDTLSDWDAQTEDSLAVTRVAGPDSPPWTETQLIARAANLVVDYARFWTSFRAGFVVKHGLKINDFDPPARRTGGWGFIANTHFQVAPDDAFVFTCDPTAAPYHAVLIGNHWWISMDASGPTGAFNTAQARANADGTITYVIAKTDPGVWNWLDTGGLHEGIIQVRWQGMGPEVAALDGAVRDWRVVKLADLKAELPPETTWLDVAGRAAQRQARGVSYRRRLSAG